MNTSEPMTPGRTRTPFRNNIVVANHHTIMMGHGRLWALLALSTLSFAFPNANVPELGVEGRQHHGDPLYAASPPPPSASVVTRRKHGGRSLFGTARSTTTARAVLRRYTSGFASYGSSLLTRRRGGKHSSWTPALLLASNNNDQPPWRSESSRPSYVPGGIPTMQWSDIQNDPRCRPYRVDLSRRRPNSYSITSQIVAVTVASFAVQVLLPRWTQIGIKLSAPIRRGEQLYRLVTPVLLHGGFFHLLVNMQSLLRSGTDFEKLYGPGRYLATYLVAGVAGNVASAVRSANPSLGASGAVFGIYGAYFTYLTRNEWLLGAQGQAMTTAIGQTMAMNLLLGLANPQIDQWAHAGGAVAGAVMAYAIGPNLFLARNPVTGRQEVIDRPLFRAPLIIESLPAKCAQGLGAVSDKLFGWIPRRLGSLGGGNQPWQRSRTVRRYAPNRSIKPKKKD
jgi:membrane associated rhomboid family serine protease